MNSNLTYHRTRQTTCTPIQRAPAQGVRRWAALAVLGAAGLAPSMVMAQTPYDRVLLPRDITVIPSATGPGYEIRVTPRIALRTPDAVNLDCIATAYVNGVQVGSTFCPLGAPGIADPNIG